MRACFALGKRKTGWSVDTSPFKERGAMTAWKQAMVKAVLYGLAVLAFGAVTARLLGYPTVALVIVIIMPLYVFTVVLQMAMWADWAEDE